MSEVYAHFILPESDDDCWSREKWCNYKTDIRDRWDDCSSETKKRRLALLVSHAREAVASKYD